mgnify:CR=1 FL=1
MDGAVRPLHRIAHVAVLYRVLMHIGHVPMEVVLVQDAMLKLTEKLGEQMAKGAELDALIRQKLGGLGYEF